MTPVNPSFNDDERALSRALHGRVDQMHEAPLAFQDVAASARGIRRNRRIIAGAGIAAALAVIVPGAMLASGNLQGNEPLPPATKPPTASDSPTPSGTPTGTPTGTSRPLDISGLPTGAAPKVAWAEMAWQTDQPTNGRIHTTDGREIELPPGGVVDFAPVGDAWAATLVDNDGRWLTYVVSDASGDYATPWEVTGGLGVSHEGNVVAWTTTDGDVVAMQPGGERFDLAPISGPGPFDTVGVTSEDCKEGRTTPAGCSVIVTLDGVDGTSTRFTSSHGIVDAWPGGIAEVTVVSDRYVGGITSVAEDTSTCSKLTTLDRQLSWKTCDNRLVSLSPGQQHLVGLPSIGDGLGPTTLDLLDVATGTPVQSWIGERGTAFYPEQAWEDDSHLLVVAFQADVGWSVVRLGLDGSMEYAVPPVDGADTERPFYLQTQ